MFAVNEIITNGSSAGVVTEHVDYDPRWKASGYRIRNVSLERFGGGTGMIGFVPDYLASSWKLVPFDWTPVAGLALEERYAWSGDYSHLHREVRPVTI